MIGTTKHIAPRIALGLTAETAASGGPVLPLAS